MLTPKSAGVVATTANSPNILWNAAATGLLKSLVIKNPTTVNVEALLSHSRNAVACELARFTVPASGVVCWDTPLVLAGGDQLALNVVSSDSTLHCFLTWAEES